MREAVTSARIRRLGFTLRRVQSTGTQSLGRRVCLTSRPSANLSRAHRGCPSGADVLPTRSPGTPPEYVRMTATLFSSLSRWRARLGVLVAVLLSAFATMPTSALAQRGGFRETYIEPNAPYDGRFVFARIRYTQGYRLAWGVDYPRMERNFLTILNDLAKITLNRTNTNVYTLDDPGLSKHTRSPG
jgi:hypothetical protein